MEIFILTFVLLLLIVTGMAIGVILSNRRIQGSCGGLNAIASSDKCVVCKRSVETDDALKEKFECPRKRERRLAEQQQAAH